MSPITHQTRGAQLVAPGGENLPLQTVNLRTETEAGIARTELRQLFANPHDIPLNLTYTFPLPANGAVANFEVQIGDRKIQGKIEPREQAREHYEQALIEGRTAALLDEERPNLFTQNLGNVPPHTDLTVTLQIDQPLKWHPDGKWEWRFPTVAAPRYLGSEGRTPDAKNVTLDVASSPTRTRASLELIIRDELTNGTPDSPSHSISTKDDRVAFESEEVRLDRDIVVRWPVALPTPGVTLRQARPAKDAPHSNSAYGLLTLVPPSIRTKVISRDVIVLLDTSGSMSGAPLAHAKELVVRLIDSLTENDRLEIVSFASRPEHWRKRPVNVTDTLRAKARQWVENLNVGGATEMVTAIHQALRPLNNDAVRQVVLVTDGLIGFEQEAIRSLRENLPAGSRLHTVGVGSATNQAFLHAAARAGRGVEIVVGLDEQPDAAGDQIVAATHGPTLVDVRIEGSAVEACSPRRPADMMSASPVLQGLRLRAEGGELTVRARTSEGLWETTIEVPATDCGEGHAAVTALVGRESVADLELDLACGGDRSDVDPAIEEIGLRFGIATRLTSWIAISEEPTVDVRQPVRVERLPQELPYGMSAEGLGLGMPLSGVRPLFQGQTLRMMIRNSQSSQYMNACEVQDDSVGSPPSARAAARPRAIPVLRQLLDRLQEFVHRFAGRWNALEQRTERVSDETREILERLTQALHDLDALHGSGLPPSEHVLREISRLLESSHIAGKKADELRNLSDELRSLIHELQSEAEKLTFLAEQAREIKRETVITCAGRVHELPQKELSLITFRAEFEFDWSPPSQVILMGPNACRRIPVDPLGTTAACTVSRGSLLRIQVEASCDTLNDVDGVELISGRETIQIEFGKLFE